MQDYKFWGNDKNVKTQRPNGMPDDCIVLNKMHKI